MEFKKIQELIKMVNKSDLGEVKIKDGDFEISLRSREYIQAVKSKGASTPVVVPGTSPAASPPAAAPSPPEQAPRAKEEKEKSGEGASAEESNLITINSPMIGTFYRSPSPDKDPYIKVGDSVSKGDVLCVIEAMKLFNEIESEYEGKVVKVLIEDSSPVEYDQPIFLIEPNA